MREPVQGIVVAIPRHFIYPDIDLPDHPGRGTSDILAERAKIRVTNCAVKRFVRIWLAVEILGVLSQFLLEIIRVSRASASLTHRLVAY